MLVAPGTTGIIVARQTGSATLTDSIGDVWSRDQCTAYDSGDCIFSTHFVNQNNSGVNVTFPAGTGNNVWMLTYNGIWNFDSGQYGTYADQNYPFPNDCTNGGDCPYSWTLPVDAVPGALLIGFANAQSSGPGLARAGFGFNIEASDGIFAVEDMITPVSGIYIGNLEWRNADGTDAGGSHWLMGVAEYRRTQ